MTNLRITGLRTSAVYRQQLAAVRSRVQQFAAVKFGAASYRDADMARFVHEVSPVVLAGRRQVSAMTDAYLTGVLQRSGIKAPRRGPIDTAELRGVPVEDVYARPYETVWTALAAGDAIGKAVSAGVLRLGSLIAVDMQMAQTYTSRDVLTHTDGLLGYERVASGNNPCALCLVAATQRYHTEDLMPIHSSCACTVEPIPDTGQKDVQVIHPDQLADVHQSIVDHFGYTDLSARDVGDGAGHDFRQIRVAVDEHGEIGPVLSVGGQHFTGPAEIAADIAA